MKQFSLCIIAKNEEKNIGRCLESLKGITGDIVVVDTGSTDNTKEIARKYGANIYDFAWTGNFSDARNFSIRMAKNNWILVVDCDEWLVEINIKKLWQWATRYPECLGQIKIKNLMHEHKETECYCAKVERFFNRRYFHYCGAIHEQLTPKGQRQLLAYEAPITVNHSGYLKTNGVYIQKQKRNMELLEMELEKDPSNSYYLFQMGQEYYCDDQFDKAIEYYGRVLQNDPDWEQIYIHMCVFSCGMSLISAGRTKEALRFAEIYDKFKTSPDFVYLMGKIYFADKQYVRAMGEFIKATSLKNPRLDGTNSFYCWYYIGLINEMFGDWASAEKFYRMCDGYEPARKRLEDKNKTYCL